MIYYKCLHQFCDKTYKYVLQMKPYQHSLVRYHTNISCFKYLQYTYSAKETLNTIHNKYQWIKQRKNKKHEHICSSNLEGLLEWHTMKFSNRWS